MSEDEVNWVMSEEYQKLDIPYDKWELYKKLRKYRDNMLISEFVKDLKVIQDNVRRGVATEYGMGIFIKKWEEKLK